MSAPRRRRRSQVRRQKVTERLLVAFMSVAFCRYKSGLFVSTKGNHENIRFISGHSCLLITWKTNPEVEKFKELYMEKEIKTHKRKNKTPVDPGDLVSEKSLNRVYKILGRVSSNLINSEESFIIRCSIPHPAQRFPSKKDKVSHSCNVFNCN